MGCKVRAYEKKHIWVLEVEFHFIGSCMRTLENVCFKAWCFRFVNYIWYVFMFFLRRRQFFFFFAAAAVFFLAAAAAFFFFAVIAEVLLRRRRK